MGQAESARRSFEQRLEIQIRLRDGQLPPLSVSRYRWLRLSVHWHYLMRNRMRWIGDPLLSQQIRDRVHSHLQAIGLEEPALATLAKGRIAEVTQFSEDADWDIRLMPWEFLLRTVTRRYRNHERLLVLRRIASGAVDAPKGQDPALTALFVDAAPGGLRDTYDFEFEFQAVQANLAGFQMHRLRDPTVAELAAEIGAKKPLLVHLTAIDGYQGGRILDLDPGASGPQEGVYLADQQGQPALVDADELAGALTANGHRPWLASFNLYNSSARLAAIAVSRGVRHAIGIQDFIDDNIAEVFFANLFRYWTESRRPSLLDAFQSAVFGLENHTEKIRGSGMSLWSSSSLLDPAYERRTRLPKAKQTKRPAGSVPPARFRVNAVPYEQLNYSVLHNSRRQLFRTFRIYKFFPEQVEGVRVEVALQMGGERFEFRGTYRMDDHILDLTERVAVGLTSSLARSIRESVRTTIFVRVTVAGKKGEEEIHCGTKDVSLLAVDEWRDDEVSGVYLPSFVLPRDPAVSRVIGAAQRYLMALSDDATQGFDGYQSVDPDADDPTAGVDAQVRAIWYALQHDFTLRYINPPPTFTESSQRLRTPSDILEGGRGTCIDLALILGACLEFVGIHPVLFLMAGHAFAGYWTREQSRNDFVTRGDEAPLTQREDPMATPLPTADELKQPENYVPRIPWEFERRRREQMVEAAQRGDLVAIEATFLTNGSGFFEAVDAGEQNLQNDAEFQSMIDVTLARERGVTPIPLAGEST